MTRAWIRSLAVLLAAVMIPLHAEAQGRGNGKNKSKGNGNGPAFCRNGQGHPKFGWQWCEDKGWGDSRGVRYPAGGRDSRNDDERIRRDRTGRAIPRSGGAGYDRGFADGRQKGLEDVRLGRAYDPERHGWYRDADRGYNSRLGSRAEYRLVYRDGFLSGYDAAYRFGGR